MVREVSTDDGTVHRCEECGRTFDDREDAEAHEADCFVPPSM